MIHGCTALCGLVMAGPSASAGLVPRLRTTEDHWSHLGVGALSCYLLVEPVPLVFASDCKSLYMMASSFFLEASTGSLVLSEHSQPHSGACRTSGFLACAWKAVRPGACPRPNNPVASSASAPVAMLMWVHVDVGPSWPSGWSVRQILLCFQLSYEHI